MSIEVLAIIVVCGIAVLLIFVGVVYKLFCGKREPVDEESCAGDDDHDEDDEAEKEHLDSTNSSWFVSFSLLVSKDNNYHLKKKIVTNLVFLRLEKKAW